jgi:hypothetical protein
MIPHIAAGGDVMSGQWVTTIGLTNSSAVDSTVNLAFYQDSGAGATQAWNPSLTDGSGTPLPAQGIIVRAGSTVFVHVLPGAVQITGWVLVTGTGGISAYGLFTQHVTARLDQDGTSQGMPAASCILVPFDNTGLAVTGIGLANSNNTPVQVQVAFRTSDGSVSQGTPITLPADGHMAFSLTDQFTTVVHRNGLAEFSSASGGLGILALRFNGQGPFTTAPVYIQGGPPVIPTGATSCGGFSSMSVTSSTVSLNSGNAGTVTNWTVAQAADGTYGVVLIEGQGQPQPFLVSFTGGTLNGTTLTFNTLGGQANTNALLVNGSSAQIVAGSSLTLTLGPSGALTGTLTLKTSSTTYSGPITGTYILNY